MFDTSTSIYIPENVNKIAVDAYFVVMPAPDFETDCSEWQTWRLYKVTGQDFFFRVGGTSFHIYSHLLTFFLCFIVLFLSCCSHARVFGKTLLHEFPIFYSHTEWNLLSSGTNTLLWWRACYQKLNYKLQKNASAVKHTFQFTPLAVQFTTVRWNLWSNFWSGIM